MLRKKTVAVPATTNEVIDMYVCDLCGKKVPDDLNWKGKSGGLCYDINVTHVEMEKGYGYPEGGFVEKTKFDICTDCFKNKLMPWLISQGAHPRGEDIDW